MVWETAWARCRTGSPVEVLGRRCVLPHEEATDRVTPRGGGGSWRCPPPPARPYEVLWTWGLTHSTPLARETREPPTCLCWISGGGGCGGCWVRWRSGAFEIPYKKCAAREVVLRANRCTERITTRNFGGYMKGKDESKSLKRRLLGWPNSLRRKVKAIVQSPCQPLENDHSRRQN